MSYLIAIPRFIILPRQRHAVTSPRAVIPHGRSFFSLISGDGIGREEALAFDFDSVVDRRGTGSLKWDRYGDTDVLPMWVADMDFRSPPAVIDALSERVAHGVFGYARPEAQLTETVVAALSARYGWEIEPSWIVWLPGLVTGLNMACRIAGDSGDAVISSVPVYPPFLTAPGYAGRHLISVPMIRAGTRWQLDMDQLQTPAARAAAMLLLCNPHNPCGRVLSRGELEAIAEFCLANDLLLCSDEIHCDLILDDVKHLPIATLCPAIASRTITLMAPSKTFNIPGLGCAFAVISDAAVRRRFKQAGNGIVPDINAFGFIACEAAYRHGGPWLEALLDCLRRNRDTTAKVVNDELPGLSMHHVEATYLAWIDTRDLGLKNPADYFERHGIGLSDGRHFGRDGFVRLNFGCSEATLHEGLKRLRAAVAACG